jgi:hypothetical protein
MHKRFSYILVLILSVSGWSVVKAQEAKSTPTPVPAPTVEKVTTPENPLPKIDDAQNVQPENLQGVPNVAPNYQSNDKTLPELGRVGVDMMNQKPLTLREAITLALENNKDIEVTRQNVGFPNLICRRQEAFINRAFSRRAFTNARQRDGELFRRRRGRHNHAIELYGKRAIARFGAAFRRNLSSSI